MILQLLTSCLKTSRWTKVVFIILLVQFGFIPQRKPGFYCNDPKLSHAHKGDTITWKMLLCTTFLLPPVFILILESFILITQNQFKELATTGSKLWPLYVEYVYGSLLNMAIVQALKVVVGEPRPDFFEVCEPDTPCEGSEFVSSYKCISAYSEIRKADAGRSFPSGHTAMSVFAAFFFIWYLRLRTPVVGRLLSRSVWSLAQVAAVVCAATVGMSRVWDRRHHWWDVLAGGILGFGVLYYTVQYLFRNIPVVWQFDRQVIFIDSTSSQSSVEEPENDYASVNFNSVVKGPQSQMSGSN